MHWGLQTLVKLVPACGPREKGGQAKGILFLMPVQRQINFHCQHLQTRPCSLEKLLKKVLGVYACLLCSHALLQKILAVPGSPLVALSSSFPCTWARRAGTHQMALQAGRINPNHKRMEITAFVLFCEQPGFPLCYSSYSRAKQKG